MIKRVARKSERVGQRRISNAAAEINRSQQPDDADDARFGNLAFAEAIHVKAHEERERNREANRERSPRRFGQRVDDDQAQPRERNHDDEKNRDARRPDPTAD